MSESSRNIDVAQLIDALRAHWRVMLLPILLVPLLAFVWANVVPPKLGASARLLVEDASADQPGLRDLQVSMAVNQRLPAIHTIVRSSATIEHVLRELGEVDARSTPAEIEGLVESFRGQIDVWSEGGGIVHLKVIGRKPARVYRGLALLTDALIAELVRPHSQALDESVKFLRSQVDRVQGELTQVEEDLRKFKQDHGDALPEMQKINMGEVERLSRALIEAKAELAANQERQRLFEESLARFDPATEAAAARLASARAKLRSLESKYTAAHPEVKSAVAVVADRQSALARAQAESAGDDRDPLERFVKLASSSKDPAVGRSYQQLVSDTEALREKITYLATEEDRARERVKDAADHDQAYQTLTLAQSAKSRVYQDLLARYEDSVVSRSLAGYESSSRIRVIDAAREPATAPKQPVVLVVAAGLIGGIALGLLLVLLLELLDPTVRSAQEAIRIVGAPVLGSVGGRGITESLPPSSVAAPATPPPGPLRRATGLWEAYTPHPAEPAARHAASGPWSLDPAANPSPGLRRHASGVSWPVFVQPTVAPVVTTPSDADEAVLSPAPAGPASAPSPTAATDAASVVAPRRFTPAPDEVLAAALRDRVPAHKAAAETRPDGATAPAPDAAPAAADAPRPARGPDITAQYTAPVLPGDAPHDDDSSAGKRPRKSAHVKADSRPTRTRR
ncbi:MAG: Wzz/FepE/Etk N-terminal domain-containing protein [Myxococcota bacterium]